MVGVVRSVGGLLDGRGHIVGVVSENTAGWCGRGRLLWVWSGERDWAAVGVVRMVIDVTRLLWAWL